jgi:hypothetical protein
MAKTVAQLIAEFGVDEQVLDKKFVAALNGEIAEAHTQLTQATTLKTEAEQARTAAAAERERINEAILAMGDGSLNASRLKAQNKVMKAALDSLKEDGLSIDLPEDLFTETADPPPIAAGGISKELQGSLSVMGQAIAAADIAARYVGIYGKPMPMDMQTLVNSAQRAGKTVQVFADEQFGLSAEMKKRGDADEQARIKKYREEGAEEYKKAHPVTSESPFMRAGRESVFASMPKVKREDPTQTRHAAGLSDMEKLRRSQEHGRQMLAAAVQEN